MILPYRFMLEKVVWSTIYYDDILASMWGSVFSLHLHFLLQVGDSNRLRGYILTMFCYFLLVATMTRSFNSDAKHV
jgi:hypothetical protein